MHLIGTQMDDQRRMQMAMDWIGMAGALTCRTYAFLTLYTIMDREQKTVQIYLGVLWGKGAPIEFFSLPCLFLIG
jgi:hypothetical protein